MNVEKKVISNLNKCYAMSEITVEGKRCFVVAAEKHDPCYLFNEDGEFMEKVWDEPGGVMTMAPVPGADGQFLATHKFYSPNDSADAKIVIVTRKGKGDWEVRTLCEAPFVHRFGIFHRAGVNYLLVCCLKSGHSYKNDWRYAGACFAAELPADLSAFNDGNLLELSLVQDGMLRNHGFSKTVWGGHEAAVIGCEQGTFLMEPPRVRGAKWTVTNLLPVPSSDAVLMDFDGDGKLELGLISPFHGNAFSSGNTALPRKIPRWSMQLGQTSSSEFPHGSSAGAKEPRAPSRSHGTQRPAITALTCSIPTPVWQMPCILSEATARTSLSAPTARSTRSLTTLSLNDLI